MKTELKGKKKKKRENNKKLASHVPARAAVRDLNEVRHVAPRVIGPLPPASVVDERVVAEDRSVLPASDVHSMLLVAL